MRQLLELLAPLDGFALRVRAARWERGGRVPGAPGHGAAKWLAILGGITGAPRGRYGYNDGCLDERVVEYAWAFERIVALRRDSSHVLDAGSVLNHRRILRCWRRASLPPVTIVTLAHEGYASPSETVRYAFADLRRLPWRDQSFDIVVSLSTLEHVGLDNRAYGGAGGQAPDPGAEAVAALRELHRVTRAGGTLLISVPFGARSNRGWFRIVDRADLERLASAPGWQVAPPRVFRAGPSGWRETPIDAAGDAGYNQPPGSGDRTAPPFVAAAEAVALVELTRSAGQA